MLCDGVSYMMAAQGFARTHGDSFHEERWSLDLNTGAAGAILALAELVSEFDDPAHRQALSLGGWWLADAPRPGGTRLPGLYVGEAGIAAAQLRAGQVLGDRGLIDAAAETGSWISSVPHVSPDLFHGTAGRLRFHLWLWQETADQEHLDHAIVAADHLLAVAEDGTGVLNWTIPPGYENLTGRRLTGYAHGAAGIGDVLLDLFETTGEGELLDAARGVGRWLERLARPALAGGAGANWPSDETSRPTMAFWCHGAAGIARFLLRLGQVDQEPGALDLARSAALVVAKGTRWAGVTQCHGLAGNVECLLDVYQATGDENYLREAASIARLLDAFAVQRGREAILVTDLDRSNIGFSTGCSGVAACLLRLAYPDRRAHLLTLRGFASERS
jgi:lantibiotic modifying enzyme